jgi:hypothetical protein
VEAGELVFDGIACSSNVPAELHPGRYSFVLMDRSEEDVNIFLAKHATSATYQDILDLQAESEGYISYPVWDELFDKVPQPGSAQEQPDGGRVHTFELIHEGEYLLGVWNWGTAGGDKWYAWFCQPLSVTEAPSD